MKHIHTYKDFINEAKAIKVELTSDAFSIDSTWGIYKNTKMTGNSTWQWNSNLLADINAAGDTPGEQNVVVIKVEVLANGKCYASVGITNHLKREPTTMYGANYAFTVEDFEKDSKKIAKEAADFLMDGEHFKWINKNIKSNRVPLNVVPKGDFFRAFEQLIAAAINDKG
jgi:hypothetical protein